MVNDPRERLEELCREHRVDFATLSKLVGKNPAYIQQYIRRGTPKLLGERERRLIAHYFGVSEIELGGPETDNAFGQMAGGLVAVRHRSVRAAAGAGSLNEDRDSGARMAFDRHWLRGLTQSRPEQLSVIQVEGDSMAPTLSGGDDILVDHADRMDRLRDGIYVLRIDDALMVKRLALHPMERTVTIQSDNPAYPDWPGCSLGELDVVGRVLWTGRRIG
ncbi:S24 family peptidase [Sphingomicrobium sp. XHP0239]|uniref:S24 family peptidase n=1 Tax=Sphingomicrobium maritimum TaxID=3133972 RepID=UPI0031CC4B99